MFTIFNMKFFVIDPSIINPALMWLSAFCLQVKAPHRLITSSVIQYIHFLALLPQCFLISSRSTLPPAPLQVIHTESRAVDLYSAGLPARLITPRLLINSSPAFLPHPLPHPLSKCDPLNDALLFVFPGRIHKQAQGTRVCVRSNY